MAKTLVISFIVGALCSAVATKILAVFLTKKATQPILKYVTEHFEKSGTPTMGGIGFIVVTAVVFTLFKVSGKIALVALAIFVIYGGIGFFDDFIKIKYKKNDGLTPIQKIFLQVLVACVFAGFSVYQGLTKVYLPFTDKLIDFGFWYIPFCVFVFLATTNCVNLTDGLDGLAGSASAIVLAVISVIIILQTKKLSGYYLNKEEYQSLSLLSMTASGSLIGYLLFNVNKASIFMGDTGSLSLGGLIASVFCFSGNSLYIPIIGFVFVTSGASVILQVLHYKKTKKRLFLMAPIHHHFQHKGYTECKITFWYFFITLIIGLFTIASFL